jgi:MFS family permease
MRALPILLTGQTMASMDASILVVAAPSLRADLHVSAAQLQLVVLAYTLVFAALVVAGARLGDVLGPRRVFLLGLSGFTIASLAGGLAPTAGAVIAARALQGASGALMTPQVLTIIQREYAGEARTRAIGAYSLILAVGVAAGQVAGGLIVSAHLLHGAWRPALLLNVPVGIVLLAVAWRRLPEVPIAARRRLDVGGAALLAATMVLLVVPLTLGWQAGWPWWVAPCLALSVLAGALFVGWERRVGAAGRDPLFDLALLRLPGVAAAGLAVMLEMGSYGGFLLCLTLHLQDGLGYSPVRAGLVFAVYAAGFATASLSWPRTSERVRALLPTAGPLVMAGSLVAVGALATAGRSPADALPVLVLAGAGHACGFSPLTSRLASAIAPGSIADLSGLLLTASLIGTVVGSAAISGVYLGDVPSGSGAALGRTTLAVGAVLVLGAACALRATMLEHDRSASPADL